MSKEEYYKKYYKVIKRVAFVLILIFYPLFYTSFQDEIEGYGWCDDSHIVIGTADKEILIFDQDGKKLRPFSVVSIAGDTYDMYLQDGIYIFPNRSDYGYLFNADGKKLGREKQEIYKQKLDITSAITPLHEKRQKRTDLEYSKFLGMQKISLHKNGTEKILFQTDATEYIIKFFLYLILVVGGVGIILGSIKQKYLSKDAQ